MLQNAGSLFLNIGNEWMNEFRPRHSIFHYAALLTVFSIHIDFVKNMHPGVYTDLYKLLCKPWNRAASPLWRCHIYIFHFGQLRVDGAAHLCDITDAESGEALLPCFALYENTECELSEGSCFNAENQRFSSLMLLLLHTPDDVPPPRPTHYLSLPVSRLS